MPSTPSFFHFCLLDVRGKVGLVSSPSNFTSAHWKLCVDAFSEWVNLLPGNTNSKECGRRRQSKLHHRARWIFCSLSSSLCFEDCIPCIQTVVCRATRNQWVLNATFIKFLSETMIKIYWLFISLKQYLLNHDVAFTWTCRSTWRCKPCQQHSSDLGQASRSQHQRSSGAEKITNRELKDRKDLKA